MKTKRETYEENKEFNDEFLEIPTLPIGSQWLLNDNVIEVKRRDSCRGCVFRDKKLQGACIRHSIKLQKKDLGFDLGDALQWGYCSGLMRADHNRVIFEVIKKL